MKKVLLFLIVLFILPITVFAKTPTLEETLDVIRNIKNITVIEGVTIESTRVDDDYIIFTIDGKEEYIKYRFADNKFSFDGGYFLVDSNNKVIGVPFDNEYAFFLYSILENKSLIPYDENGYYNTNKIRDLFNNNFSTHYKESSNTFGVDLVKIEENKYKIVYNYYLDGDYPIIGYGSDDIDNPATGNYNLLITIMLIAVLCIGIYSYVNRKKKA